MNNLLVNSEPLVIQLSNTTADDQAQYFTGDVDRGPSTTDDWDEIAPGQYRVVAGALYRVVPGIPPAVENGA